MAPVKAIAPRTVRHWASLHCCGSAFGLAGPVEIGRVAHPEATQGNSLRVHPSIMQAGALCAARSSKLIVSDTCVG